METQISLPVFEQKAHFKDFIQSIVQKFQPLQIFCFARNALSEETAGCFFEEQTKYKCNYCLLLVTESPTRIDYEVQDFSNTHYKHGTITILCHGRESIEEAIKANSRFFITVYRVGKLIYSHDGMTNLDFPFCFIPSVAAIKAKKHFDYRLPLAESFLIGASECLNKEQYNVCVFMLHQVVEQTCIGLIRVCQAYRSEIHNLHRLLRLCCSFSYEPIKTFLSGSYEDERLFDILQKSYSGVRYKNSFVVLADDAWLLYNKAVVFIALAKDMCTNKIVQLQQEAEQYKELAGESEVDDE